MQFTHSNALTMGMELEFQIVDIQTGQLSPSSLAFRNALEGHAQPNTSHWRPRSPPWS